MAVDPDIVENMRLIIFPSTPGKDTYCIDFYNLADNNKDYDGPIIKITGITNGTPVLEELAKGTPEYECAKKRLEIQPLVKKARTYFRDDRIIEMLRKQHK